MKLSRVAGLYGLALLLALSADAISQEKKKPDTYTDPKEAGPEYLIQGEYVGTVGKDKFGVEVVAKGNGNYLVNFVPGGLRGDGGDQTKLVPAAAKTEGDKINVASKDGKWAGVIAGGKFTGKSADGAEFTFEKTQRKSPTEGAKPPEGAIVLFDGTSPEKWGGGKIVDDKLLFCGTSSKDNLPVGKLHLEFRSAFQPKAGGQGRGNSGVYIWGKEIQVLDSFGLKAEKGDCGAYYGEKIPDINMCYPPLSWQTYDVEFKKGENGTLLATVLHNGVKIHDNFDIKVKPSATGQKINLQNHGDPVHFRNIWYVPLAQ